MHMSNYRIMNSSEIVSFVSGKKQPVMRNSEYYYFWSSSEYLFLVDAYERKGKILQYYINAIRMSHEILSMELT
jgi:hypothetical protein